MKSIITNFIFGTVGNIIGAFVGFGLALYLQRKTDKASKLDKIEKVIKSITEELSDISQSIQDYMNVNQVLKQKIPTPAWDAILSSGIILELIEHPLYNNLINVYSSIKFYNELQRGSADEEIKQYMNEIIIASNKVLSNN